MRRGRYLGGEWPCQMPWMQKRYQKTWYSGKRHLDSSCGYRWKIYSRRVCSWINWWRRWSQNCWGFIQSSDFLRVPLLFSGIWQKWEATFLNLLKWASDVFDMFKEQKPSEMSKLQWPYIKREGGFDEDSECKWVHWQGMLQWKDKSCC